MNKLSTRSVSLIPRAPTGWALLAACLALCAMPLLLKGYELFLVSSILISTLVLAGLNLQVGHAGLLSLGHGAFVALGAYAAAMLVKGGSVPVVLVPLLAGLVCAGFARLFGVAALRLEGMQFALALFGLAVVAPQLLRYDALQRWTGGSQGIAFTRPAPPPALGLSADAWMYALAAAHLAVVLPLVWRLARGRTGRAWQALHDNPVAASAMGVQVAAYRRRAFVLGAMLGGMGGALQALLVQYVAPDSFSFMLSITLFVGLVVGGIGAPAGPLLGACFVVLVPNFAEQVSQAATSAIYGAVVITLVVIDKRGLAGLLPRLLRPARTVIALRRPARGRGGSHSLPIPSTPGDAS
ncbi:branched-chain amino acid ABC transporter permease [Variovorax defluvii]|uniref:Branched-chain amino acid ABC transporter permease n=1 Tax=Variovorax defluvii TaxID=913761 RepID=A0ABP8HEN6_9BURK